MCCMEPSKFAKMGDHSWQNLTQSFQDKLQDFVEMGGVVVITEFVCLPLSHLLEIKVKRPTIVKKIRG